MGKRKDRIGRMNKDLETIIPYEYLGGIRRRMIKPGVRVHVDSDNVQWGRVASDGVVVSVSDKTAVVECDTIRATIVCNLEDITVK